MRQYWFNELKLPNGGCLGLGCCPGYRLTPLAVIRQPGSLSEDLALIAAWKPRFMRQGASLIHVGIRVPGGAGITRSELQLARKSLHVFAAIARTDRRLSTACRAAVGRWHLGEDRTHGEQWAGTAELSA